MSDAVLERSGTVQPWEPLLLLASLTAVLFFALPAAGSAPNSCVGYCGGKSSSSCFCDTACTKFGDCCSDFGEVCHGAKTCGTIAGLVCEHDEFCEFPPGTCNISDNAGTCTESCESYFCPHVYKPVCGCDGHTYSNECEAKCAQAAIDHPGECKNSCPGGGGSSKMAKAWIRWRQSSPSHGLDCPACDQFNSSGGAVLLKSNSSNKHFEFVFENLGWKFECDCSSHKGPLAHPTGPRGTLQVTLADKPSVGVKHEIDDDDDSKFFSWFSPAPTVCSARFAQPTQCLPGGASEDLHVEVDCSRSVSGFHLLFLR